MELGTMLKGTNILQCLECGKCTANCPISKYRQTFSPRRMSSFIITGGSESIYADEVLWSCLTCGMCNVFCPSDVNFSEFIRMARVEAAGRGITGTPSHGGTFYSIMKMMGAPTMQQNRLGWLNSSLKVSDSSDYLYFVGCNPYFDEFFTDIGVHTIDISRNAIKILNSLGIEPMILKNERCCGHDLLWTGDVDGFKKLAEHNLREITESGVEKVVFSCAEGYRTFKIDIPNYFGRQKFETIHISEFLAAYNGIDVRPVRKKVTFQDPCRLGRHCGLFDQPRQVLAKVPDLQLIEMGKSKQTAVCCGTSAWMNCDTKSKQIQKARLAEAHNTGADILVTSCPKCYIHFTCAQNDTTFDQKQKIEIKDLTVLIGEALL